MQVGQRAGDTTLLEREDERSALLAMLERAEAGRGGVALISGPAGLGKSSLLDFVRAEASERGFRVASAVGSPLEREFSFGVALRLFEPLVRDENGACFEGPASLALPLLRPQPGAVAPATDIFPFVRGLHWLAIDLADRDPLLVAVDDVQWSDLPSLRFLVHLAQRIGDAPIALVIALRTGEHDAPADFLRELAGAAAPELHLSSLSEAGSTALVQDRLPRATREFTRGCFEATGGNPFLLVQLLAEIGTRGIEAAGDVTDLAPDGVLKAVAARLDRLPAEAKALALAAAMLPDGTHAEAAALAGLELDAAARAADALTSASLMEPGDPVRFVHPLIRSAVDATAAPGERQLRHHRAARLLWERSADPERVAGHLMHAHCTGDPWAVERLREAARSPRSSGVPAAAAAYLKRALAEPPPASDRVATLVEVAQAEAACGDDAAVCHLEEAVALTEAGAARAAVLGELGQVLYSRGRIAEAAAAFDRGLAELGSADETLRLQLEAGWVTVARLDQGLRSEAVRRMEPLLARPDFGASHAERVLLANVANQVLFAAEPRERAIELARRALADGKLLAEETADGMTWCIAGGVLGWADELDEFGAITDAAVEDARRRGSVFGFAQAVYARSFASYYRGELESALADLELAIDARRHGWGQFLPAAIGQYAWALVERDELDAAERALIPAISEARAAPGPMLALLIEAHARVALARGNAQQALDYALEAGRLLTDSLIPNPAVLPWRGTAGIAAARLGERELGLELTGEAVELARRFGAPRVLGMALRAAGVASGGADGAGLLREAVAVLEGSPARLELARALIDLGAAMRREREAVAAREPLRRALDMAVEFGALALERRAREELAASGARPRRGVARGRDALTPSEVRIATSAAAGMSNKEIAQSLFLTMRTVETHLTHAYRKLGIASRSELPEALLRATGDSPNAR